MIDLRHIKSIYFIGAGGIGMSALARYFMAGGFTVGGYDRTETELTRQLVDEGCQLSYSDNPENLPELFKNQDRTLVIYTPAVQASNKILTFFSENSFELYKRAEILGRITENSTAITIAGTHGKTSVSTLTAHLLKQSAVDCSAFLGGISRNYNTNFLKGSGDITVVEADEFDRSFHKLKPYIALITSLDADHLDVYGNYDNMVEAYNHFAKLVTEGGSLVVNSKIRDRIKNLSSVPIYTYGLDENSDFRIDKLHRQDGAYYFDVITPSGEILNLISPIPGMLNLENCVAAISLATLAGVSDNEIRSALINYRGVRRRFDIRIDKGAITYIDDYAHHPGELDYFINSVREFYGDRQITIVFQPHLYSRTQEHADAFARSLDVADRVILLPIYPAREEPINGVSSQNILDKMVGEERMLIEKEDLLEQLDRLDLDILLTVGAGDIDTLVEPIEKMLKGGKV